MSLQIKDSYATVFKPEVHETFVGCNLSTGRKVRDKDNPDNVKYINSSWRATFVGSSLDKAKLLSEKDRIKIISGTISHEKSQKPNSEGKYMYYYNVTVFDFESVGQGNKNSSDQTEQQSEDLPF